jgi:hypothetical protein
MQNGNFVVNDSDTGNIYLYSSSGAQIASTNAWTESNGWAYNYSVMGDIAGLLGGGFVVLPEFGAYYFGGAGHTPYMYFYNDSLNLINKVDITSLNITITAIVGLSTGGFAGIGNTDGGDFLSRLFYFDSSGNLISARDITGDIPYIGSSLFVNFSISATNDGGVIIGSPFWSGVWIYHSPPVEFNLSGNGVTSVGGVGGSYFQADYQCQADLDNSGKVNSKDLLIMKIDYNRTDCLMNPCEADCNGDGKVDSKDLLVMKIQYNRSGCPVVQ